MKNDYKELAWHQYQANIYGTADRSEFEDEYCGTYDSLDTYMMFVYYKQLEDYPEHDNRNEYRNAREHAEALRDTGVFWWVTEEDGTAHIFEHP